MSIHLNKSIEVANETFLFIVIELWAFHLTNGWIKVRDRRGEPRNNLQSSRPRFICYAINMDNISRIDFIAKNAALDLWEFGEDEYVDRALALSDAELRTLGERAYSCLSDDTYEQAQRPIPISGYDIGFVVALVLIEYFEGRMRPLKRSRRRSRKRLPDSLVITAKDYGA